MRARRLRLPHVQRGRGVVQRLQRHSLTLDVTGLSGKPLYNGKESKFAAEVSMLSKDALDNASGARAEVLRHSGNGRRR